MDVDELRSAVGPERFDGACEWAWWTARGTGDELNAAPWPDDLADVPHDLDGFWRREDLSHAQRLELGVALYRVMPCSWNTVGPRWVWDDLGAGDRERLWVAVRELLDDLDDRLADPVLHALATDVFEDHRVVADGWERALADDPPDRRLGRLLRASGPVPWALKRDLYTSLAAERRWHGPVAAALVASATDVMGQVDPAEAAALLDRLRGVDEVRGMGDLRARLSGR